VAVLAGLAAPLALAAILVPFRGSFPNTDAALALILVVVARSPRAIRSARDKRRRAAPASVSGQGRGAEADAHLVGAGEQVGGVGVDPVRAGPLKLLPAVTAG
jgi:hypothetical protein